MTPTTSPRHSTRWSSGIVGDAQLPHQRHLHLARVRQLVLDRLRDLARETLRGAVADLRRVDHDAQLAAGLDRERLVDALEAAGDLLELLQALDVLLERVAAGAG